VQAHLVKDLILQAHQDLKADDIEITVLSTKGDRILDRPLSEIGGKGLFTEEIEEALFKKDITIAVHSLKDMPTVLPSGLELACYLEREDVRDAFICATADSILNLPKGAVIGSASLRRAAQTSVLRPDLKVVRFRGNVQSRLQKLSDGVVDATYLAMAGLKRLELNDARIHPIETDQMLPAVAQGAICIEIASDNDAARALIAPLNHLETELRVRAERQMLQILDGSCRTPIAGLAIISGDHMTLTGRVLSDNGAEDHKFSASGPKNAPEELGKKVGLILHKMRD
jgi:hydroxymethylbilane synthase